MKSRNLSRLYALSALFCIASTSAHAQPSVTIYGAIDVYVAQYNSSGTGNQTAVNSGFNPNNLGFAIREDLGGGASAGAVLEMQPVADSGSFGQGGKPFGRQSFVYLGGNWGQMSLGRIHTPGRTFGIRYSPTGWLSSDPGGNLYIAMGTGFSPAMNTDTTGARLSNAIAYTSPTIGGVSATVMHSVNEGQAYSTGSAKVTTGGIGWANGPINIDLVYGKIYDIPGFQVGQTDLALGGSYNFTFLKAYASIVRRSGSVVATAGAVTPIPGSSGADRVVAGGISIPFGADAIGLGVARMNVSAGHSGFFPANVSVPFATRLDNATVVSVAYTKNLSKRTQLFASYGLLKNDPLGNASFNLGMRPTTGGQSSIVAAGLRVNF